MKLSQMIQQQNLELLTKQEYEDKEITGGYCGDLLSWVMGQAQTGDVWITIMTNVNIVAVATLTDVACILLAENAAPEPEVIDKANEQDVVILRSGKTSFALAGEIFQSLGN